MTKERDMQWIPVYYNNNYLVNIYTGQVKNKKTNRVLKERVDIKNQKIEYSLSRNNEQKYYLANRIVMCSCLKKELSGLYIIHKDGDFRNNNINNLKISKKKRHNHKYRVIQYKNDLLDKIYSSISEFNKETGICFKTLKKRNGIYEVGNYRFEVPAYQKGDYIYEN